MFQDYKGLLSAFQSHGAKYLIVGGYAVIFHAQPRFIKDMDVFIQSDLANAKAVFSALAAFGVPLQGLSPEDFADQNSFFRFGNYPHGFDVLPKISGVEFEEAWKRRVEAVIDEASGLTVDFISAEDLIAAKLAGRKTARPC